MQNIIKRFDELTLQELHDLLALRQEIFVVEQECAYLDIDGFDKEALHVLFRADEKSRIIAYARIAPVGLIYAEHVAIGRVLVAEKFRSQGYGKKIMKFAMRMINDLFPLTPIKISAQCYLENFYTDIGFKSVGASYLEDGIPHIAMVNNLK